MIINPIPSEYLFRSFDRKVSSDWSRELSFLRSCASNKVLLLESGSWEQVEESSWYISQLLLSPFAVRILRDYLAYQRGAVFPCRARES